MSSPGRISAGLPREIHLHKRRILANCTLSTNRTNSRHSHILRCVCRRRDNPVLSSRRGDSSLVGSSWNNIVSGRLFVVCAWTTMRLAIMQTSRNNPGDLQVSRRNEHIDVLETLIFEETWSFGSDRHVGSFLRPNVQIVGALS